MNFISFEYIVFLIVCIFISRLINNEYRIVFLLLSSYVFYSFWDYRFLSLILISTVTDFFISKKIYSALKIRDKKILLSLSILINLSILFTFKYFNFFIDSFLRFGLFDDQAQAFSSLNIILPVGISFYTFQTISYTVDVYNHKIKPEDNFFVFATFVCFFPQLVAGPIERAENLIPQIKTSTTLEKSLLKPSLYLILQGFVLKTVVADNLSKVVENLYQEITNTSSTYLLIGTICFSIQIYCDFAGYSRIARGSAGLLGIQLSQNFNFPYLSKSIQEFWRRWHITLSFWFRDYLYIPLGGNRKTIIRNIFNLIFTMTIAGLWHGAAWNFVLWGFLYGLYLSSRYFQNIIKVRFKDLFFILLAIACIYQSFIKPYSFDYFERYGVTIEETSIYNYFNFPADGRCLNSFDDIKRIEIPDIQITYEYVPSSFKCHSAVMAVNSETFKSQNELIVFVGKNELIPIFITRKIATVMLIVFFIFQKRFQSNFISIISTFFITNLMWIPFRVGGIGNITNFLKGLWINNPILGTPPTEHWTRLLSIDNGNYLSLTSSKFIFPITIFVIMELIDFRVCKNLNQVKETNYVLVLNFFFILILLFSARTYSPFIYFQF